ncbi:hypothetical protein I6N90_18305 [Paenibacillus sp. GSMTC-2017]|uniref:hypothetical protein n=1 Tax=Paenibacillus sp. GSMTC-2017 TaxID=2794350 RepID=UPI0018D7DF27|nr:hypothetical protein [Paenibacillus sp. GSMTC-2017]MBH5319754.1 hypothetical protein [Paenibacillus sp. GSMTC-2017]
MLSVIGLIVLALCIAFYEMPTLIKKRKVKELWVFSSLLLIGTSMGIAESLHVLIPNPIDWIIKIYTPISEMLNGVLI